MSIQADGNIINYTHVELTYLFELTDGEAVRQAKQQCIFFFLKVVTLFSTGMQSIKTKHAKHRAILKTH